MKKLSILLKVVLSLFALILLSSKVLLNHSEQLELDKHYLTEPWLLSHYGMGEVEADAVYLLDNYVISQFDSQLFIDASPAINSPKALRGGIIIDDLMVIATVDELLLFSREGEFIERMTTEAGIPPQIQNIGLFHGDPVIQTHQGMWRSDFMLDQWESISLQGIGWSEPMSMPASVEKELATYFYGKGISVERLLIDVNNGQFMGSYGRWIVDIVSLLFLFILLTVLWPLRRDGE
ncbi:MAG: peptidase [Gammaproteobacteria bacterium]|nr:MAG: peptidase [Gammaproteobacteria bacterium]